MCIRSAFNVFLQNLMRSLSHKKSAFYHIINEICLNLHRGKKNIWV